MKVEIGPFKDEDWNSDEGRKIDVHIDDYDVWNLDHSIALIALPGLKKLKEVRVGSHNVDPVDVPETLRPTEEEIRQYKEQGISDDKFSERWEWVLDEMIWAMSSIVDDEYLFDLNNEEHVKAQERIQYGCYLFGKYFTSLWD